MSDESTASMGAGTNSSGPRKVVDFVCHHYPEPLVSRSQKESTFWQHLGPIPYDAEALLDRLVGAGVDAAVLSMPRYMGLADTKMAVSANDALLDVVTGFDEFYGLASLPTGAGGEAAAAELERAIEIGLHGGAVETRVDGKGLTDPSMEPLLEVADRAGAPLLVHPALHDSLAPGAIPEDHFYNAIYGREVALCLSLSNVLYNGLAERYPEASLVFHHLGGNLASSLGRIRLHADAERWPFRDDLLPAAEFERRLRQVYIDTSGHGTHQYALGAAVDSFSPSNVLFATDTPFETRSEADIEAYVDAVVDVTPTKEDADAILGNNALDLLVDAG